MKTRIASVAVFALTTCVPCFASVTLTRTINIVGYCDIDVAPGLNMIGVSFQDIGATNSAKNIQCVVKSPSLIGIDWSNFTEGDSIIIWNPSLNCYDRAFLWAGDTNTTGILGYDVANTWIETNTWTTANIGLQVGRGFWIQSCAPSNILCTLSGEVPSENAGELSFIQGQKMLGNPFPNEVSIADVTASGLEYGDVARFWRGTAYEVFFYYGPNDDGVYTDDSYEICLGPGWGDSEQIVVSNTVSAGEGFWIDSASSGSVTFPYPDAD